MRIKTLVRKQLKVVLLAVFSLSALHAAGQTFTQRLQTPVTGQGSVIIRHDAIIDQLVNGKIPLAEQQPSKKPAHHDAMTHKTAPITVDNTPDSEATNVKRYRTTGYRIQVFRGGNSKNDRERAEAVGASMRSAFPNEAVYVEFFAPDWTCRVGNFRELEEARKMRNTIRGMGYDAATIVKGKIIITVPQ